MERAWLAVPVCFTLAVFVVFFGGIRLAADSPVLVHQPARTDFVNRGPSLQSPGYRTLVAASLKIGTGLAGVVALQVVVATLAAVRLLTLGRALGGAANGCAAVCLFALNPDQIRWHAYILPDSLYTSILILTVASIHDAQAAPRLARVLTATGWAFVAGTLNATGYLLLPIILAWWLVNPARVGGLRWRGWSMILAAMACLLIILPSVRESAMIPMPATGTSDRGIVVRDFEESWLPMPVDPSRPGERHHSGLPYAINYPGETLHLAGLRILAVLAHVRPYYTARHNFALLGLLAPVYCLTVLGLFAARRKPLVILLTTVIAVHLLMIALTYTDWDGRSLLLLLPLIGVLAARGFVMIRWPQRVIWSLAIPAVLVLFFHSTFLTMFAFQFRVDDPAPSDALVLLLGGERDRPHKAAELYRRGMGPMVLIGADQDLALNRDALIDKGVAVDHILSLGPTIGTREEAWRVRVYIDKHPEIQTITVVTTAFHTARACWIFRRALRGSGVAVHIAASNDPRFDETDWYTKVDGVQAYSQEIFKFAYAYLCGGQNGPAKETESPAL